MRDDVRFSSDYVEVVAEWLKAVFRKTIEESSGMSFNESGVHMPKDEIWNKYAQAVVDNLNGDL